MCNLYSELTTTDAMVRLRAEWEDYMRNMPPLYAIYPDYTAPIIREPEPDRRTISLARWGLPSLKDPVTDRPNRGNTNIRHPWIDDWKGYLSSSTTAWCRSIDLPSLRSLRMGPVATPGSALDESQPLMFFAGLQTPWHGTRRKDEGPMAHELFAFFTTVPNDVVRPIHEKAMLVILRTEEEWDVWLHAPWSEAKDLQRPLPHGVLQVIARSPLKYVPGLAEIPDPGDPLRRQGGRSDLLSSV